jgi:hypothetical protein
MSEAESAFETPLAAARHGQRGSKPFHDPSDAQKNHLISFELKLGARFVCARPGSVHRVA